MTSWKVKNPLTTEALCSMIAQAVEDRPDLNPRNNLRFTRIEMIDGKPVRCYIETKPHYGAKEEAI